MLLRKYVPLLGFISVILTGCANSTFNYNDERQSENASASVCESLTETQPQKSIDMTEIALSEIGDTIYFGDYKWMVLDKYENTALLITNNCIASMPFNEERKDVTWETCTIRKYLNSDFYDEFSEAEKKVIIETNVKNENNPRVGTYGGNDTRDKVFLLSIGEVSDYFHINEYFKGNIRSVARYNGEDSWWWMRSVGSDPSQTAVVRDDGGIHVDGYFSDFSHGIRPAMWVEFDYSLASACTTGSEEKETYEYFTEAGYLPKPDSCIKKIKYSSKSINNGIIQYTYSLAESKADANVLLEEYNDILFGLSEYEVEVLDDVIYVSRGDTLISAMMAGYDNGEYFLMISFQE